MFKKTLLITVFCLSSSGIFALTTERKLELIDIAKEKYKQLSEAKRLIAFQYSFLNFIRHQEEVIELTQKLKELQDKLDAHKQASQAIQSVLQEKNAEFKKKIEELEAKLKQ